MNTVQPKMKLALLGAAGNLGKRVGAQALSAGYTVRGLVRTQQQAAELAQQGIEPVMGDLLGEWQAVLDGTGAVIWAAGASAGGDYNALDRDALMRVTDTLTQRGPRRFVVVSSGGVGRAEQMPPYLQGILAAKEVSDRHLQQSGLDWTIVRPGGLTDEPGSGLVQVGSALSGRISRSDVAAVMVACLNTPATLHQTFEVIQGLQSITAALGTLSTNGL